MWSKLRLLLPLLGQCIILCTQCGFTMSKPLEGSVRRANQNTFGFVVSMMRVENQGMRNRLTEKHHICTGSLVSKRDVLTAMHCVIGENKELIRIMAGSTNLRKGWIYLVSWWITHESWLEDNGNESEDDVNDLAIIRLAENVHDGIPIATLPTTEYHQLVGSNVELSGWGMKRSGQVPRILESGTAKVLAKADCENKIEALHGHRMNVSEKLLCTAGSRPVLLTYGDSGSPVVYQNILIAVSLQTCPIADEPFDQRKVNLHLIVDYYLNFIEEVRDNYILYN